jgi:hypothetical protein
VHGQGQNIPRVLKGHLFQARAVGLVPLALPARLGSVQISQETLEQPLVGVKGLFLHGEVPRLQLRVGIQLGRNIDVASPRPLVALAVLREAVETGGQLQFGRGQPTDLLHADMGHGVLGHAAVAVADHPLFVELAGLLLGQHVARHGRIGLGGGGKGQLLVGEQPFQVLAEREGTAADVGKNDGDHFFRQVEDDVHIAVEIGDVTQETCLIPRRHGCPSFLWAGSS